jgi:replication-associated recombination protein RarA
MNMMDFVPEIHKKIRLYPGKDDRLIKEYMQAQDDELMTKHGYVVHYVYVDDPPDRYVEFGFHNPNLTEGG